jgi:integrase
VRIKRWLTDNPAVIEKARQPEKPPKAHTWKAYCALAEKLWHYRPPLALLVEVLADSGARISEILDAKAGDVDAERGIWQQRVKGGNTIVRKAERWMVFAASLRKPGEPLCPREDGKPFRYHVVARALGMRGIDAHDLRHSRATWMVESGAKPRDVQELLGHTTLATTEIYFRHAKRFLYDGTPRTRDPKTVLQPRWLSVLHLCCEKSNLAHSSAPSGTQRHQEKTGANGALEGTYNANRYTS